MKYLYKANSNIKGQITVEACLGVSVIILLLSFFFYLIGYLHALDVVYQRTDEHAQNVSLHQFSEQDPVFYGKPLLDQDEKKRLNLSLVDHKVDIDSKNVTVTTSFVYSGIFSDIASQTRSVFPVWSGDRQIDQIDNIWSLPPMKRGIQLQSIFGGNLPHYFPLIDVYDDYTKTATVMTSMDITLSSYASRQGIIHRIRPFINDLYGFTGASYQDIHIPKDAVKYKRIWIIIPENQMTSQQKSAFEELKEYAKRKHIEFQIHTYQMAGDFQDKG